MGPQLTLLPLELLLSERPHRQEILKMITEDAAVARHFVHNVDKARHGEFVADVLNNERRVPKRFPATLQEAIDSIRSFIPSGAVQQAQTQLLAYNANFQQDDTSDSSKCFRCGKTGH